MARIADSWVARLALSATLFGSFWAAPAAAQLQSSEAAGESRRSEAKLQFSRGAQSYRAGQYREAVSSFLEADRLAPSPALSFNIARAYEKLGDSAGALRWYRDYLRRSPSAKNAAEVRARIAELAARLAQSGVQQITVLSTPLGATVVVDGRALGVTPFTGELTPGNHRLLLDLTGYQGASREVVLAPRAPLDVTLNLEPEAQSSAPQYATNSGSANAPRRALASKRRFGVLPWLVTGAGVASLGGAAGFELARRSQEDDARDADTQLAFKEHTDRMARDQTRARVLAGVGGALLVTGGVLMLVNTREPEAPRVGLGCTLHGCSALARGSF